MANRRKHEAFNKIHTLWFENYDFISLPFINVTKEQAKTKIIELLKEMVGKEYHLNDKENICEAISQLSYYRKLQILTITKIEQDGYIFKKELNESSKALIGFETIRLFENANYDRDRAIKMLDNDINSPDSPYKKQFDVIYTARDKLLDSMIQLNKAKSNSQVVCKLVKLLITKLNKLMADLG